MKMADKCKSCVARATQTMTNAETYDVCLLHEYPCDMIANCDYFITKDLVRCKDCKHRKEYHYEEKGEKPCIKYGCKFTDYSMSDEGFCSFGKRAETKKG